MVPQQDRVGQRVTEALQVAGISVSLFLDPDLRQIEVAAKLNVNAVELHTGRYALARPAPSGSTNWSCSKKPAVKSSRPA